MSETLKPSFSMFALISGVASGVAVSISTWPRTATCASRAITQFFFDTDCFLRFQDRARAAGITVPIIPGIMPVTNFNGAKRMAVMNGASVPESFARMFEGLDNEPETRKLVAVTVAAEQCTRLQAHGVKDFHFYTLNRADLTFALCHILGLRAAPVVEEKIT